MADEKVTVKAFLKADEYASLKETLIANLNSLIEDIGLDWLQTWPSFSFADLTDDEIAVKKDNIELIALGLLFKYNLDTRADDSNAPYSPGVHYWRNETEDTQSYHLFLSPPVAPPMKIGGHGGGKNAGPGGAGGSASVTPTPPPPPKPPY
jgi:hypothetical protein